MSDLWISTALSFFLLMDSVGNVPIYVAILKNVDTRRALWIVFREMCIALIIILLFAFFGNQLLSYLNISHETIYISGGIVLFMISIKMLFPEKLSIADCLCVGGEPFIFPLALPLVSGPSILAAVMIYSKELESKWTLLSALFAAWLVTLLILLSSPFVKKWLGEKGLLALERLMGFLLILIAVNMVLNGWKIYSS